MLKCSVGLCETNRTLDDLVAARSWGEMALTMAIKSDVGEDIFCGHFFLGNVALSEGQPKSALSSYDEAWKISSKMGVLRKQAMMLDRYAQLASLAGQPRRRRWSGGGGTAARRGGVLKRDRGPGRARASGRRSALGPAAYDVAWSTGRALNLDEAVQRAREAAGRLSS